MLRADRVVVDIAHHVDNLAGDSLASGCVQFVFPMFMRERERRGRERSGDDYREDISESLSC